MRAPGATIVLIEPRQQEGPRMAAEAHHPIIEPIVLTDDATVVVLYEPVRAARTKAKPNWRRPSSAN